MNKTKLNIKLIFALFIVLAITFIMGFFYIEALSKYNISLNMLLIVYGFAAIFVMLYMFNSNSYILNVALLIVAVGITAYFFISFGMFSFLLTIIVLSLKEKGITLFYKKPIKS